MNKKFISLSACILTAFLLWTVAVISVDVRPIGPAGSSVGFAALNGYVHNLTGVHMVLYILTDWLSLVPILLVLGFAVLGLSQWIVKKSLWKVDFSILVLGGFYCITGAVYLFFERFVVNYRPVLINGVLEASYPSSTTVLVICVMSTAVMQLQERIRAKHLRKWTTFLMIAFTTFMVIGRLLSGVHWFTDIIGGILLSAGLVILYAAFIKKETKKETA